MEDNLRRHQEALHAMAADLLDPYIERLTGARPFRAKEFNDPVWGTVQLRPEEVVILDSPLLQRLRRIKQLGVVHFVYPGATHSRLEHSIGVVHQVQALISSLNAQPIGTSEGSVAIDQGLTRSLRLAALCHDVGHGAMSHVSEYAMDSNRSCQDLRQSFQDFTKKAAVSQLSEIGTYFLLGSPAFSRLLERSAQLSGQPKANQRDLQRLIIGQQVTATAPLVHELISGPFDADKLDYLPRDAAMCGVPKVTDVPRLIAKVRAVSVPLEQLTDTLKRGVHAGTGVYTITGLARSGGRTLDELTLGRVLMFDKVYRHQKVRAAEAMVFAIYEQLARLLSSKPPAMLPFLLTDEQLLDLDAPALARLMRAEIGPEDDAVRARFIEDVARRLRDRQLFARGLAFAKIMTDDAYRDDPLQVAGLERLLRECSNARATQRFVLQLAVKVERILSLLDRPALIEAHRPLNYYLRVSAPKPPPKTSSQDTGHAVLIDNDGRLTQVEKDAAETQPWGDAYIATRDLGHVFCPADLAPFVFIAGKTVLREMYGVRLPASMAYYAKQDNELVDELERDLEGRGYFDDLPGDLRPTPAILLRGDAQDRLRDVEARLKGYSGPSQLPNSSRRPAKSFVGRDRITDFVSQFAAAGLVDEALMLCQSLRVIGRDDANRALSHFLANHAEYSDAACVTLGEAKDSSAVLSYYVGDTINQSDLILSSLPQALGGERPLIFVDDFVGRGSQSISIIEALLDESPSEDLGEDRVALPPKLREVFRERPMAMVFVSGMQAGAKRLKDRLQELSIRAEVYVHIAEDSLPFINASTIPSAEQREKLVDYLNEIGRRLMANYGGRTRAADWVEGHKLGYGNTGLLLASTYNTPSATTTALWAPGTPEFPWMPLLPRRKKV